MIKILIAAVIVLILFFTAVILIDENRFVVREYSIKSDKIKEEYSFLLLADLHNKEYGKGNQKLLDAIAKQSVDAVMLAGDMLTAKPGKKFTTATALIEKLAEKYPVYYGIGNHEYRMKIYQQEYGNQYQRYMGNLKNKGAEILENRTVPVKETNLAVSGVMIEREYYKRFHTKTMDDKYLQKLLGKKKQGQYTILLAHNPDYIKQYADWGADLVLSGHVHGGIMRLPFLGGVVSPKCTLFPKYDGGLFREKDCTMILSRGLGTHTIPIRIFNPGELIVIHLLPCK